MEKIKLVKYVKIKYAIIKAKRIIIDIWMFILTHILILLLTLRIIRQK